MAGIIGMSGVGGGSSYGEIINFQVDEVGKTCFFVSYDVRGVETDCTHNLVLNGKELGADGKVGNGHFELTVANLEPETEYGVQIKINNNNNNNGYEVYSKTLAVKTEKYPIYSVIIDETDPNPSTRCTYANDSVDILVATHTSYGGWENIYPFNSTRPCGLKNGEVVKYINPNDYTKYEDETPVTEDVDVMIEIPKFYWNTERIDDSHIRIDISQWRYSDYWDCPAHTSGDYESDYIYVGVYEGSLIDKKMRSVSGQTPSKVTFEEGEEYCTRNGEGYHQYNYFSDLAIQILYLTAYKNTDSQSVLGHGNAFDIKNTGSCDNKGMVYGKKLEYIKDDSGQITDDNGADKEPIKFLGIENLYGNTATWLSGLCTDDYGNWIINMKNDLFKPYGINENCIKVKNSVVSKTNYISTPNKIANVFGFRDTLFLPSGTIGVNKFGVPEYYCDTFRVEANSVAMKGENDKLYWNNAGIFNLNLNTKKDMNIKVNSRLVYIPPNPESKVFGVRVNETVRFAEQAVTLIENSTNIEQPQRIEHTRIVKEAIEVPIEEIPMTIPELDEGTVEGSNNKDIPQTLEELNEGIVEMDKNGDTLVTEDTPMTIPELEEDKPKTRIEYVDKVEHYYTMNNGDYEWIYPYSLIRPVALKDGKIVEYIEKEDFSKYINGSNITDDVDVMIEFPKLYICVEKVNFEEYEVKISNRKINEKYICPAHTVGTKEVNNIYIAAYEASQDATGKIRSQSGKKPITNMTLTNFRAKCQERGKGYNSFNYYSALLLEALQLIMYPYLNCQWTNGIGYGNVGNTALLNTGQLDKFGMTYGYTYDKNKAMKFLGIENLWGNTATLVDGIFASTSNGINSISLSKNDIFNDTGEGYEKFDNVAFSNGNQYIVKVHADSKLGFIAKEFANMDIYNEDRSVYYTTLYSDSTNIKAGSSFTYGGSYKDLKVDSTLKIEIPTAGVFCLRNEATSATVGGRLIYIPES